MTGAALGNALGVKGQTIHAVECGARSLSPQLRARAEAFFAKQLLEPAGNGQLPPEDLVKVTAWVTPRTMTAALRLAKKHDLDVERVLGEWTDRPRENEEWSLERAIVDALRSAINAHGPITPEHVASAANVILWKVVNARGRTVRS